MQFATHAFIPSQQWELLVVPVSLIYILLVHLLRDRRAKSLKRRFSPAGRASFSRMTTNDAQAILRDLTELEFPKLFGFSIIFALFKARNPDDLLKQCLQERPAPAYSQTTDLRTSERFLPSRCYRAACRCRDGIETNCRHWSPAVRLRTQRADIR